MGVTEPPNNVTPQASGDGPVYRFFVLVFEDENRWRKFRQLMLLLGGLTVMLAGLAVLALIYAPSATVTTVLSTATLVGVGTTTGGGLLTYQQWKRMRAANEFPVKPSSPAKPRGRDGEDLEPRSDTDE